MVVAAGHGWRCAITDLASNFPGAGTAVDARQRRLEQQVRGWAVDGVELVQLREKSLDAGELFALARAAKQALAGRATRLLVNGRPDVAAAARADGVQLSAREGELLPEQVRRVFQEAGLTHCVVGVSCHSLQEVAAARDNGADLILFGPVFEKRAGDEVVVQGVGLRRLREACTEAGGVPLLALGGVTTANTAACLQAGAAGVAGIRLFA